MARMKRSSRSENVSAPADAAQQMREGAAEIAPQMGTVAIAAAATALVEAEFLPAVLIGASAAMAPTLLRGVGFAIRPHERQAVLYARKG